MNPGDELPPLTPPPISVETLVRFAKASGDDNPIHLNHATAASRGYDGVIAHGMLSMAYLGRLVTGWAPQHRIRSLRARFVGPTPVGAMVTCTGRVRSVDEVDGEQRAKVVLTVTLADGTTTVRGEAIVATVSRQAARPAWRDS